MMALKLFVCEFKELVLKSFKLSPVLEFKGLVLEFKPCNPSFEPVFCEFKFEFSPAFEFKKFVSCEVKPCSFSLCEFKGFCEFKESSFGLCEFKP